MPAIHHRKKLAIVVPGLGTTGGLNSVAVFLNTVALSSNYEVRMVSLPMDSLDATSVCIRRPATWARGVRSESFSWQDRTCTKVGTWFPDIEVLKYRPNKVIARLLSDVDLIQVVAGSPAWANAVCGLGKPVSLQVATRSVVERQSRDTAANSLAGRWRRCMTFFTNYYDDKALRRCNAIQVENTWMLEYSRSLNSCRDCVIDYAPPGVDTSFFTPLRNRSHDKKYILSVGRFDDPRKNTEMLARAYIELHAKHKSPPALIVAGATPPPQTFWRLIRSSNLQDHVQYIEKPSPPVLRDLYQGATLFILSSTEEGLGIVLLEAMSCGIPAIATRCGGPDNIITHGVDGLLCDVGDHGAACNMMQGLLDNMRTNNRMGNNARKTIVERYSTESAATAFLRVWTQLSKD